MLTLKECIDWSGLEEEEIEAIAEHEHIPDLAAVELGHYLLATPEGRRRIKVMLADDLDRASACGNRQHAAALRRVLANYVRAHPD